MVTLHTISQRLVLVAWFYGGFFSFRTVTHGEHMPGTTEAERREAFQKALDLKWLKPMGADDYFLDHAGWEEVAIPLKNEFGLPKLKEMYPSHYVNEG